MLPIVYHPDYNIDASAFGVSHAFDTTKFGKVLNYLLEQGIVQDGDWQVPGESSREDLLRVHTEGYLDSLHDSERIAFIAEVAELTQFPAALLHQHLLRPFRLATTGSRLAVELAEQHGWAINMGGGYHHAKDNFAHGFCFFADINLAAGDFFDRHPGQRLMVVDLDAHQGNGFEAIFKDDPRVAMLDMYNKDNFPRDYAAAKFIQYPFPLSPQTNTETYLDILNRELPLALDAEHPGMVIYNAGVDIYKEDWLGDLAVSADGIVERDRIVFSACQQRGIPIAMLFSGGYHPESWRIIGRSMAQIIGMFRENQPV